MDAVDVAKEILARMKLGAEWRNDIVADVISEGNRIGGIGAGGTMIVICPCKCAGIIPRNNLKLDAELYDLHHPHSISEIEEHLASLRWLRSN